MNGKRVFASFRERFTVASLVSAIHTVFWTTYFFDNNADVILVLLRSVQYFLWPIDPWESQKLWSRIDMWPCILLGSLDQPLVSIIMKRSKFMQGHIESRSVKLDDYYKQTSCFLYQYFLCFRRPNRSLKNGWRFLQLLLLVPSYCFCRCITYIIKIMTLIQL